MRSDHPIELAAFAVILLAGGFLFVWMIVLSDAVPMEYRSASPGFGWSWDFNYEAGMRDAGRLGAEPWPWPAKATGNRFVLKLEHITPQYLRLHATDTAIHVLKKSICRLIMIKNVDC